MCNDLTTGSWPPFLTSLDHNVIVLLCQEPSHVGKENRLANAGSASDDEKSSAFGTEPGLKPLHCLFPHFRVAGAHDQLWVQTFISKNVGVKLLHLVCLPLAWLLLDSFFEPLAKIILHWDCLKPIKETQKKYHPKNQSNTPLRLTCLWTREK